MRTQKAILNLIGSLFRNFSGLLIGMISTPIILSYLGDEKFGVLRVLFDWLAHLSLFEFGLYAAVTSYMTKVLGQKKTEVSQAFQVSFIKYSYVLALQVIGVFIFCLFFDTLVPTNALIRDEAFRAFLVLAASSLFIYSQIFKSYLEAAQRGYIVSYTHTLQNIVYVALAVVCLMLGGSLITQALAHTLSLFLVLLVFLWICRPHIKFGRIDFKKFDDERSFKKQRWSLFVTEICARASLMSDNLIITFMLGAKEVTAFFLTQRLIQMAQAQLQHVGGAAWPAIGELYYEGKLETFRMRVLQTTEVVAFLGGVGLSALIVLNPSFIVLWTGESTYAGLWVSNIAAINAGFFSLMSLWSWCFSATHKTDKIAKVFIGQALINLSLAFVLTQKLGMIGPLLAALIGYAGLAIGWMSYEMSRTFEISLIKMTKAWFIPMVLPLTLSIVCVSFWGAPQIHSWSVLALALLGLIIFNLIVIYTLLLHKDTKLFFINKIKSSRLFKNS